MASTLRTLAKQNGWAGIFLGCFLELEQKEDARGRILHLYGPGAVHGLHWSLALLHLQAQCLPFNCHLLTERTEVVDFTVEEIKAQEGEGAAQESSPGLWVCRSAGLLLLLTHLHCPWAAPVLRC